MDQIAFEGREDSLKLRQLSQRIFHCAHISGIALAKYEATAKAFQIVDILQVFSQGPGYAEVFEAGLGLFDDVIPLPHANNRLQLDNPTRVSMFARRFNHASCLTLETGSRVDRIDGKWAPKNNIHCLRENGAVETWEGP